MYNGFTVTDNMIKDIESSGADNKFWIAIDGVEYLVKDSSYNNRRKANSLYPFCEYAGSNFILFSGLLPCQKTYLGRYQGRPVVICEDLFPDKGFKPFQELHQSSAGTDLGNKEYTYSDVLYILQKKSELNNSAFNNYKHLFWLMFMFDAILGNRDRHSGNWGFVKRSGITYIAPIFDNGNCLFPDVPLAKTYDKDFIKLRTYRRPPSQFKMWKPEYPDRPMRTNFWEILSDYTSEFLDELMLVSTIDCDELIESATVGVPEIIQNWFCLIVHFRFECLIRFRDFDEVWEEYFSDKHH